jgi:hypothetical protein
MIELNLQHVADVALRAWLMFTGLLVAGHYHAMANYLGRAPHLIKAVALPSVTGAGVGMAVCAAAGATLQGAMFGALAAGIMALVNLAAWRSGAYVSEQFERADRMKRYRNAFLRDAVNGSEDLARLLEQDSDTAPLTAERKERYKA